METKAEETKRKCLGYTKKTGGKCGRSAMPGAEYCATHMKRDAGAKRALPKGEGLCVRIEQMVNDPGLLSQIKTGVAAIKALLDEHLAQLDEVRMSNANDAAEEYAAALESHGKRIQSLAGELFEAIDRISRVEERQRKLMKPDEIRTLIANIRERVIRAAEASKPGEPPEALARRMREAFENIEVSERA
ncbi:MAG: hypothetical protein WCX65_16625 [bacterium]